MKSIVASLIVLFAVLSFAAAEQKLVVKAKGMTCQACVNAVTDKVQKAIGDTEGVHLSVEVNKVTLDLSKVDLSDAKKTELRGKVEQAIRAAKFEVAK